MLSQFFFSFLTSFFVVLGFLASVLFLLFIASLGPGYTLAAFFLLVWAVVFICVDFEG